VPPADSLCRRCSAQPGAVRRNYTVRMKAVSGCRNAADVVVRLTLCFGEDRDGRTGSKRVRWAGRVTRIVN
jgi:hypothetical protein